MRPLLTPPEVSDLLHISVTKVRRLASAGDLPYVRIGSCLRFHAADVDAYIERQRSDRVADVVKLRVAR